MARPKYADLQWVLLEMEDFLSLSVVHLGVRVFGHAYDELTHPHNSLHS